jgi:hypothetical protein
MLQDNMLIIHTTNSRISTLEGYYDYDPGDQDTVLRLGENLESSGALRNRMKELLDSPTTHRRSQYPFAEEDVWQQPYASNDKNQAF